MKSLEFQTETKLLTKVENCGEVELGSKILYRKKLFISESISIVILVIQTELGNKIGELLD